MEDKTVTVIGAVNMDVCGRPAGILNMHDSNPGEVTFAPGGVGRNIAHDLRLLGVKVRLVAAVADDVYGESIMRSCLSLGIDMSLARTVKGGRTSSYVYICDETGDMAVGVCDTDIAEMINPEYLAGIMDEIDRSDAVVIDGNLPEKTVAWIAENCSAPLYADPVSAAKSVRLIPALPKLSAFKPNGFEAMHMTGKSTPEDAARALIAAGVKRVFVSLGEDGMLAAESDKLVRHPTRVTDIVNSNGAGDAAAAAMIWAGIHGLGLEETAAAAQKAAALTISCAETVNPRLCVEEIIATD